MRRKQGEIWLASIGIPEEIHRRFRARCAVEGWQGQEAVVALLEILGRDPPFARLLSQVGDLIEARRKEKSA